MEILKGKLCEDSHAMSILKRKLSEDTHGHFEKKTL